MDLIRQDFINRKLPPDKKLTVKSHFPPFRNFNQLLPKQKSGAGINPAPCDF